MVSIKSIKAQIRQLDDDALAQLRNWFIERDHDRRDHQIATDSQAKAEYRVAENNTNK